MRDMSGMMACAQSTDLLRHPLPIAGFIPFRRFDSCLSLMGTVGRRFRSTAGLNSRGRECAQ